MPLSPGLRRRSLAWLVGGVLATLALVAVGLLSGATGFEGILRAWFIGWILWVAISIGSLGMAMVTYATRSRWGNAILRIYEAGCSLGPMVVLLIAFVPVALGIGLVFPWMMPGKETGYLNPAFFLIRLVLYFVIWLWFAIPLRKSSLGTKPEGAIFRANVGAPGLVILFITATFACFDWLMSLHPGWTSTIYGLIFIIIAALAAHSHAIAFIRDNARQEPYRDIVNPGLTRDFGNLLLTILMLWAYFNFSQYIVMWSGDIPREVDYFTARSGGWDLIAEILIGPGFFLALLALTSPRVKASIKFLGALARWMLFIAWLNLFWMAAPPLARGGFVFPSLVILSFFAIGGFWRWTFLSALASAPLVSGELPDPEEETKHVAA